MGKTPCQYGLAAYTYIVVTNGAFVSCNKELHLSVCPPGLESQQAEASYSGYIARGAVFLETLAHTDSGIYPVCVSAQSMLYTLHCYPGEDLSKIDL